MRASTYKCPPPSRGSSLRQHGLLLVCNQGIAIVLILGLPNARVRRQPTGASIITRFVTATTTVETTGTNPRQHVVSFNSLIY